MFPFSFISFFFVPSCFCPLAEERGRGVSSTLSIPAHQQLTVAAPPELNLDPDNLFPVIKAPRLTIPHSSPQTVKGKMNLNCTVTIYITTVLMTNLLSFTNCFAFKHIITNCQWVKNFIYIQIQQLEEAKIIKKLIIFISNLNERHFRVLSDFSRVVKVEVQNSKNTSSILHIFFIKSVNFYSFVMFFNYLVFKLT